MEKALQISYDKLEERYEYVKKINMYLREKLKHYDNVQINTPNEENPFILNLGIKGVTAVNFKQKLEEYGVCISIKSACSVVITPSRPVMAITHDRKRALSSWRISLSHLTTIEEINKFLEIFNICYNDIIQGD
jgi:cysteine desulfurase